MHDALLKLLDLPITTSIDFTPLFWFGIIVGIIISVIGWITIKGIIWLISHLQWI